MTQISEGEAAPLAPEIEVFDGWNPRVAELGPPRIQSWLRAPAPAPRSARMNQCVFAFLSDSTLMFNTLRPYGRAGHTHRATSLDHPVWFQRAFDASGELVASVAQESMLRAL